MTRRFFGIMAGIAFVMGLNCILLFSEIKGYRLAAATWWCLGIILVCVSLYQPKTKEGVDIPRGKVNGVSLYRDKPKVSG